MTPPSFSTPDSPSPHRPAGQQDGKRTVAERLQARKRRVSLIRRRTVAIVATVFVAAWSVIFIQLASGHDPALSRKSAAATTSGSSGSGSASAGTSGSSSDSAGTSGSSSGSSGTTSTGASVPAPVTTSQS